MQDLHAFFKELRFSAGAIWLKDEAIKFSAPVKFQNFETDQFIIKNKDKIKAVLKENGIDSKLKFVNSVILKDPVSEQQILSFAQERLWFIEQYEEGSNAYHIPIVLELLDGVDVEGIKYAIGRIVSRHEVLRSTIDMSADQRGIQVVHTEALQVESISVSAGNFESILKAEINDPFDLRTEYPVRVKVYDLNPDGRRILLINIHHIASDGWSMGVFQSELLMYYESYVRKDNAFSLPALEIQYKDYAIWQRSYLSGDLLKDQLGYWVNKFAGYQNLSMPTDYVRPSQVSYRGSYESFIISKEVSDCLRSLSRKHGVTLNSVLLSSIKILLSKYTGQEDIVVGSPIANRHHRQTENLIGFFVNMQASRTILNGSESYSDLVVKVHQDQIESQRYQDLPFEMLVDALAVERDPSKHPIFQVSFGLQSFSSGEESSSSQANYFKAYTLGDAYEVEKFDLSFYIDDSAAELNGQVSYAVSLFTRSTISRMIGHYVRLLTQLAENPAQPYSQINLLSSGEYSQIVEQWNRTEKPYRQEATLHELFYEQVARSSESVALVYGDSRLSYGELNQRSNQLARYIRQQYLRKTGEELKADTLIALCLDRSPEMVIGILAVLKAGGAYVPIDPEYPQERIDYMLEDTGAQLVLTHQEIVDRGSVVLPSEKVLLIDLTSALYQSESSSDLDVNGSSSDLAYVIYTSGTTGRPKGVMVEHRGVINLGFQQKEKFNLTAGTKVLQYASLVFDASVWEIFSSLITGGELHVVPDTIRRDSQLLIDYMDGHGINLALIPPALLGAMPFRMLSELRTLLVGGESCPSDLMHQWSVGRRLVNAYGPTEYTVIAAMHEYAQGDLHTNIGKPLSNTEVYVLDSFGQVVPVGVAGELYIGGSGIARGYLNNRELTSEHFLPNRFKGDGSRLYRTGDLVRWLADGNLEYLGRNDEQVKIRGYRIELGEIEHALLKLEGIRQASVLCKERKSGSSVSKYLVGYYVSDVEWSPDRITDELSSVLPEYMVPAVYVRLEHFPLTVNGKLDKMKLPDPEFGSEESYVGPSTELEEKMCLIWQDVLGISRVGVQDDFFRIGGNSILAIRVSHRMSETLGVEIKVADVFKHKTISRLLLYQLGKDQVIIPRSVGDSNALSFAQERLWFIEQYEEGSNAYHIPIVLELLDGVDVEGIKYAIGRIVSRHEVLRSTIDMSADQRGIQVVHTEALQVESISVSAGNFESILKAEINDPFDLRTEYPVRVKVYDLNPDGRRILLINIHHIASDGWSMGVFQSELLMYYESYVRKDNAFSLPALEIQYKDYAIWQRSYLSGDLLKDQLGYWVNKFAGYQNLSMPTDYVRPSQVSYRGSYESFIISKEVSDCLRSLSRKHGVTLNSVLLSSIKILLSKYTGQEDIVVGSPIANRHHRQTENLIGFFVNMQASRTILNGSESYSDLVVKVHQDQIESQRYQDLPFEMLVDALAVERDPSKHPIFQVSFGLQSFSSGEESSSSQANYFKAYTLGDAYEVEKFDLSFYIDDSAAELNGQVSYAVSLFTRSTISRMIGHYVRLLTQLAENPAQPYSQINLLSSGEYSQIVEQWNRTEKPYRQEATLHELFYEQVARSSESVALVYGDSRLSYGELNQRSNQLARYIRQQYLRKTGEELKADTLIALCLDRSPEMVIGILAVLKAGGAYVPIDPEYPQERIDYMLEDTGAQLVLTHQEIVDRGSVVLPSEKVLLIDLTSALYQSESSSDLDVNGSSSDLAYVIYTSGTTGRPKGVMVEHRSIHNTIADLYSLYREGLKVSAYTSYVFDVSVSEIFSTLLQGSELHLLPQSIRTDSVAISEYLQSNKIVLAYLPPVMLSQLPVVEHPHLKTLIYAGEPCDKYTAGQWSSRVKLYNYYGPTEASVYATFKEIGSDEVEQIGKPLSNTEVYVLDSFGQVVPVGVAGELYIGGSGIARGYLNNRELTSERFLPNRFKGDGSRLYRTGDLVRWLADGNLEYLGRNDEQVKIRGYRIELGEIEHALLKLEGIRQASVLCKERKSGSSVSKYLVGYYVSDVEWSPDRITDELSSVLPEYMVPAVYVRLEHFPLTVNGKLDKRALPDSEFVSTKDYVAPATDTEIAISQIWQEVLGLDRVGLKDDFFRIGGDSILSIQVSSRIRQAGYHCQVKDIFSYKTLEKLSAHLDNNQGGLAIKSEQGLLAGSFELLPVQQWFAEQVENGLFAKPSHWNQSILLRVPALDQSRLYSIIKELVSYHDVLRISYQKGEPAKSWHQLYKPEIPIPELRTLDVREHTELELHQLLTDWQSGFDLEQGPLFQAGYLYGYGDGSARLYFSMHHLIVDGVSWRILAEDIKTLYEGRKLPAKGSSYRQWVSSVSQYAVDHAGESVYWERQLSGLPSYESLRSQQVDHSSATLMELPAELTKTLLQESSKAYHTEINDLLLTALAYALRDINQHEVQGITLEGHGREAIDSSIDHSRTIGWFTTMFPVSLELQSTLKESIQGIKESLRRIPNKGIGFGAFATREHSGFSHDNLAPISFNYLGQFGSHQAEDWQPAPEGSGVSMDGANGDRYLININGMVSGGKLCFTVVTRLGDKITQQLGDSLKTHLTGIIHHCEEQLVTVGECYTPSDFKEVSLSQGLLDQLQTRAQESQNGIAHIYTATSLQQGFIYHALSQSEDDAYRVQVLYDYHQGLDVDKYIEAWELCIAQYPILRTAFNWEEELVQIIYKRGKLNWKFHDISHLESQAERDAAIEAIQIEDRKQGFDLSKPTLLRLHIMKQSVEYYTVLKSEHHSISDGWSVPILLTSIHQNYQALVVGKQVSVKEDTAYLTAQQYISSNRESVSDYWSKTLSEVESVNDINGLLSEPLNLSSYKQVEESKASILTVEGDLYKSLKALSQREGITISVMVQFLWHKLLQVYSGSKQTIVGTTVSGRDLPVAGIEQSVGLYINTLPLIIDWENDNTILSQLHLLQDQLRGLSTHSFANLAKLQRDGERLFHSLFVYENYPLPKDAGTHEKGGAARVSLRKAIEKVDYPLSILAFEQGDTLTIKLQYDGLYLTDQKASSHIETLKYILEQVVKDPGQRHGKISLLSSPQYSQIVEQWNRTEKPYRQEATLHELFYEQVARSSESVALVYGDSRLSYGELNQRSNQLARYIRQQYLRKTGEELKADTLIALCLDRSPEMVIGILAVLKAGGAYVPIDPEYPQERIDYMLEDTGAQLVLTHQEIVDRGSVVLPSEKVLLIDLTSALYQSESSSDLDVNGSSSDLAYVIYTSGTTGRPKGVMVEHRSIHNTIADLYSLYREGLKVSAYTSYVFDVSVSEIFSTLLQGSELHLLPQSIRTDSVAISEYLQSNKIVLAYLPPVMLSQLPVVEHPHLKTLIYAGEPCDKYTAGQWSSRVKLYNYYGPTEASVYATFKEIGSDEVEQIGKPLSNTEVYVLDSFGQVVPVGVAGELYIGGSGIARGYLNNRELTSERFLPNRFKGDGSRLYRTGDLVRWLADGNLEYLGRNDEQVKIRGYRIELGEIEHALLKLEGIRQASVLCKERKSGSSVSKYLVGYYVSDVEWSPDRITDELSSVLPEYMVPAVYVRLEHFPLTVNGKLDKRALPDSEFVSTKDYVAPATDTEIAISQIWQEVLGLDRVGLKDDFFRIGGDSILSIQVSSRIRQAGYHCQVKDIFSYKTLEKLSAHLDNNQGGLAIKSEQGLLAGSFELLPVQQWFAEQVENGLFAKPSHWNQSILLRVPALDQSRLYSIIKELVSYHDVLRISYQKGEPAKSWHQLYKPEIPIPELRTLDVREHTELELHQLLTDWQSGFDLRGSVVSGGLPVWIW
jgi:amino acid adenylation domain-containing protein/non-ribosomal peptide synthase protein (TIGR01720 family)